MLYTTSAFRKLCERLYNPWNVTVHMDVDVNPLDALAMAEVSLEMNMKVETFFRLHAPDYTFLSAIPVIKILHSLGVEIGYHHEAIELASGLSELAIDIFKRDLELLREVVPVRRVCSHSSYTYFDNDDIWDMIDWKSLKIDSPQNLPTVWSDIQFDGQSLKDFIDENNDGERIMLHIHAEYWRPKLSREYIRGVMGLMRRKAWR